jgi:hypothetical protein
MPSILTIHSSYKADTIGLLTSKYDLDSQTHPLMVVKIYAKYLDNQSNNDRVMSQKKFLFCLTLTSKCKQGSCTAKIVCGVDICHMPNILTIHQVMNKVIG